MILILFVYHLSDKCSNAALGHNRGVISNKVIENIMRFAFCNALQNVWCVLWHDNINIVSWAILTTRNNCYYKETALSLHDVLKSSQSARVIINDFKRFLPNLLNCGQPPCEAFTANNILQNNHHELINKVTLIML